MGKTKQIFKWLGQKYIEMGLPGKDGKPNKTQKALVYASLPARAATEYFMALQDDKRKEIIDNTRDKLGLNTNINDSTTKVASIPGYTKEAITKYGNTKRTTKF